MRKVLPNSNKINIKQIISHQNSWNQSNSLRTQCALLPSQKKWRSKYIMIPDPMPYVLKKYCFTHCYELFLGSISDRLTNQRPVTLFLMTYHNTQQHMLKILVWKQSKFWYFSWFLIKIIMWTLKLLVTNFWAFPENIRDLEF